VRSSECEVLSVEFGYQTRVPYHGVDMVIFSCMMVFGLVSTAGDWPEPRQNPCLTGIQPLSGAIKEPPRMLASFDLGRSAPAVTPVRQEFIFGTSHGGLYALGDNGGAAHLLWRCHLPSGSGAPIAADLDGDGRSEIAVPVGDGHVLVLAAPG